MSIAQGGNGFPFLAKAVYDYIVTGKHTNVGIPVESVPEGLLKFAALKVCQYSDNGCKKSTPLPCTYCLTLHLPV